MEVSLVQRGKHMLDLVHSTFRSVYNELKLVDSRQNILEYIRDTLNMSNSEIVRRFSSIERRMLEINNVGDVNLLYKLLHLVCGLAHYNDEVWATGYGDTLEFNLTRAKNLKNDLIHALEYSPEKVSSICSELKELLARIVDKVEERVGKDVSNVRQHLMAEYIPQNPSNWEIYYPLLAQINKVIFTMVFKQYNPTNLRIKQFCFENLGFSESIYKRTFNGREKKQIDSYQSITELDPMILYRVLERIIPPDDGLCDLLKRIKNKRNEAVHIGFTEEDYQPEESAYDWFLEILTILDEVSVRSGQNFNDIMAEMGKELHQEAVSFAQWNTLRGTVLSSSVPQPTPTAITASTMVPPSTSTVPLPSSTNVPASSTVPLTLSATVPSFPNVSSSSATVPSSSTVLSTSAVPSSTVPSSSATVPSSSSIVLSSSTVPSSSATVPSSSTSVPSSTVKGTTMYMKDDMNVVRVFASLRRGGPAVKTFAIVFQELFPDGLGQLVDYCKNVLGYTGKELKSLKKELKAPVEKNMKLTELDLSLLYMCLGYVGLTKQEEWSKPANTLEHYFYLVKMKRNFLAHEVVRYTDKDLAQLAVDLPQWLGAIVRLLGDKCGKDMSDKITDTTNELEYIFKEQLPVEDISDYRQRLLEIRKALTRDTLARARMDIKKHYGDDRYKVVTPVTWCCHSSHTNWDVNELYTELKIVDSSGFSGVTDTVSSNDIFSLLRSTTRILVVEGAAGSGKTSLCKFAVHRWKNMSHKMDGLVDVDLLIFIQCRHAYSETLTKYLTQDLLKETFRDVDRDDVILSLSDARLLFVVDGFDEAQPAARTLLKEALTKFPSSAFIITTRPEFRSNVEKMIKDTTGSNMKTLFRIVGFEATRREEYIRKLFDMFKGDPDPFLKHLKIIDRYLGSFTQLPLTLALLVLLWNDDVKKVSETTTVTGIYKEIVTFFQKRLVARQENRPKETRHSKVIEGQIKNWLRTLARIAWKSLQENVMSLSEDDEEILRDMSDEQDIDSTDALSCLLQCNATVTQSECYENWEFIHKSIEEFLAGEHLSIDIIEENASLDDALELPTDISDKFNKTKEYSRVIQFIAGLLVEKNSLTEERAQQVLQLFHYQLPWTFESILDLSRECKSSSSFVMCLSNMFRQEILLNTLEGYETESLHFVLQETALCLLLTVTIKIYNSDAGKMKPLLDLLSSRGCFPRVILVGDDPECVHQIIETLSRLADPSNVEIIFEFATSNSFSILIREWQWSKPLYLQFASSVFPLLLVEFVACLALHSKSPSKIIHRGPRSTDVVRSLAERLGIRFAPYTTRYSGEIIFIGQ